MDIQNSLRSGRKGKSVQVMDHSGQDQRGGRLERNGQERGDEGSWDVEEQRGSGEVGIAGSSIPTDKGGE